MSSLSIYDKAIKAVVKRRLSVRTGINSGKLMAAVMRSLTSCTMVSTL